MTSKSWTSPKTQRNQPSAIAGVGFFAIEPIKKGEIIAVKAGNIIDRATLEQNRAIIRDSEMQIADELFLAPLTEEECKESMISFNHSCNPNAGLGGAILVVAMRDIQAGEELTTDYAMHFTDPTYRLVCNCGSGDCRKVVTGSDWKRPDLQRKYAGYFSWYIQNKINQL